MNVGGQHTIARLVCCYNKRLNVKLSAMNATGKKNCKARIPDVVIAAALVFVIDKTTAYGGET
jgi:hypothetical protein